MPRFIKFKVDSKGATSDSSQFMYVNTANIVVATYDESTRTLTIDITDGSRLAAKHVISGEDAEAARKVLQEL